MAIPRKQIGLPKKEVSEELTYIDVANIIPNKFQPRKFFDQKELEDLAEAIDSNGLLQPIIVRKLLEQADGGEEYELIAGERRWRAHKLLEKSKIKAIVTDHGDNTSATLALIENLQRADLSAIEESYALSQLMDLEGCTQDVLAKKIGKSRSYVANSLRILKLPDEVQAMISKKELEAWHGISLLALPQEKQLEVAQKAVEKSWSVAELKNQIDKVTNKTPKAEKVETEEAVVDLTVKYPVPDIFILIKLDAESERQDVLDSLSDAGLVFYLNEDIKSEIKAATSPLLKVNEERAAKKALKQEEDSINES